MFEIGFYFCCTGCGEPGRARVKPPRRSPGDVRFRCPVCSHTNVVATAHGIGTRIEEEPSPDMPVERDSWKLQRRRAVMGVSRRPGDDGWHRDWPDAA
jgi:hypothetical protein